MNDVKLEKAELQKEEVNIYTPACGATRTTCVTDCPLMTCLISCEY